MISYYCFNIFELRHFFKILFIHSPIILRYNLGLCLNDWGRQRTTSVRIADTRLGFELDTSLTWAAVVRFGSYKASNVTWESTPFRLAVVFGNFTRLTEENHVNQPTQPVTDIPPRRIPPSSLCDILWEQVVEYWIYSCKIYIVFQTIPLASNNVWMERQTTSY
jgi:hypothetical protein